MTAELIHGCCLQEMAALKAAGRTVHAIVTDPPYGLAFMNAKWDAPDNIAFRADTWRLAYELLPPGGHMAVFGGSRTHHRVMVALEDAGFEIRDCLFWLYGSGFPKSLDVSKQLDRMAGAEREVIGRNPNHRPVSGVGYEGIYAGGNTGASVLTSPATPEAQQWAGFGSALKPSYEPVILARRPLDGTIAGNVLKHGVGALNIDACRTEAGRWPTNVVLSYPETEYTFVVTLPMRNAKNSRVAL